MKKIYQYNFSAGGGNALQACIASIFSLQLDTVPNFIAAADYLQSIQTWLIRYRMSFFKVELANQSGQGSLYPKLQSSV